VTTAILPPSALKLGRLLLARRLQLERLARLDPFEQLGYEPECAPRLAAAAAAGYEIRPGVGDVIAAKAAGAELPDPCGQCPQEQFMAATEFDVGFGGRAGGGKTLTMLAWAIGWCAKVPGMRFGAFRRTLDELDESFGKELVKLNYARALGAEYIEQRHILRFPNQSAIRFRYAENLKDATRRTGGAMQGCLIDERQTMMPEVIDFLRTRIRSERGVPLVGIRSTFNPGDIGHASLKARYPDATNMGKVVYDEMVDELVDGKMISKPTGVKIRFIPGPPTAHLDPSYWSETLAGVTDPMLRRALQRGDWDIMPNGAFPEWRRDVHVIEPEQMPVPLGAGVVRALGIDYGVSNPFCTLWGAIMADGVVVIYRELYKTDLTPEQQAVLIMASEARGERGRARPILGYLDPACFTPYPDSPRPGGPAAAGRALPPPRSIASDYTRTGVHVTKAYNDRLAGKRLVHDALRIRHVGHRLGDGKPCHPACGPRLRVYSTCTNLIRTLPYLPRDPKNPEDVNTKAEDHAYDALRYLLAGLAGKASVGTVGASGVAGVGQPAGRGF
jgi:hypothetical protein